MCTLTWEYPFGRVESGYDIHFNRDESRFRKIALPPKQHHFSDTYYLAPIDSQAMGTWILVNNWGFSACLLNNYIDVKGFSGTRSRGLLVLDLADCHSIDDAQTRLNSARCQEYNPFDMFLFDRSGVYLVSWNGEEVKEYRNPEPFKSSSGFNPETVIGNRRETLSNYLEQNLELRDFHRSHQPKRSAQSVCMHRDDARTQSYTRIQVRANRASMEYTQGPPCSAEISAPLVLNFA